MRSLYIALPVVACTLIWGTVASSAPQTAHRIGVIAPLTGDFARYGERIRKGVVEAGIPEEQLFFADEGCDAKTSLTAMESLRATRQVHLFIGPFCGSPQIIAATQIKKNGDMAILGSSAPERVHALSGGRMFGTQYTVEQESGFNARALNRLGFKTAIIVLYESDFSRSHEAAFTKAYSGSVLDTLVHSSDDASVMKSFALRIKQLAPQALYVPDAYPLLLGLLKELNGMGLGCLPVFSVYSAQARDVIVASKGATDSLIYSYPTIGDEDAVQYFSRMAAFLLKELIAKCASIDCIVQEAAADKRFGKQGVIDGNRELKTVREGKFVPLTTEMEEGLRARRCKGGGK